MGIFADDTLEYSQCIELFDKGKGIVLKATNHKLPQQKPLEAVRTDVVGAWKKQQGMQLAGAAAADAVKRLEGGQGWDQVAKSLGLTPKPATFVSRSDPAVPTELRNAAFRAPKPEQRPVYLSVGLENGDAVVADLSAVREDPSEPPMKEADLRRQYANRVASGEAQGYSWPYAAQVLLKLLTIEFCRPGSNPVERLDEHNKALFWRIRSDLFKDSTDARKAGKQYDEFVKKRKSTITARLQLSEAYAKVPSRPSNAYLMLLSSARRSFCTRSLSRRLLCTSAPDCTSPSAKHSQPI